MKNRLIKLLDGYTTSEFEALGAKVDSRIESFDEQIQSWQELLQRRDNEVRRLTDLFLARAGYLIGLEDQKVETKSTHKPMNNRVSWPTKAKELERQDAKAHADRIKQQWEEKQARQNIPGTGGDAEFQRELSELA